jgi:hypothetical protein
VNTTAGKTASQEIMTDFKNSSGICSRRVAVIADLDIRHDHEILHIVFIWYSFDRG